VSGTSRLVALSLAAALALPAVAAARSSGGKSLTGYDISYPQCGSAFPTNVLFGIVGVNAGIVYSPNPCLGTSRGASELAWAEQHEPSAILYANTADPGPALSSHWPTGQATPQYCDGSDSSACSYDYGWNAAADSYRTAVDAYVSLGKVLPGATDTPHPNEWWLDVESANSWESNTANNVAALQGEVAYLQAKGAPSVGFYSTGTDWQAVTGGTTAFSAAPSWHPGSTTRQGAQSWCGTPGVTGGPTRYAQYRASGFDADVRCF
jgi:hypothetical protein